MKGIVPRVILTFLLLSTITLALSSFVNVFSMDIIETAKCSNSGTLVSGIIWENTTWTLEGSPYIVVADVIVERDVFLTIEPGVVIKFTAGANLIIDGGLIAEGIPTNKITFTSNASIPTKGDWGGILIRNNNTIISNVIVEYAQEGIRFQWYAPTEYMSLSIANIFVSNNGKGIVMDATRGSLVISDSVIFNNIYGLYSLWITNLTILNTVISNNTVGIYGRTNLRILNSKITNNLDIGVQITHATDFGLHISKSVITDNGNIGIHIAISPYYGGKAEIHENHIYGNGLYNIRNAEPAGVIPEMRGPFEVNATYNWWGTTNETLIEKYIYDYYDDYNLGKVLYKPYLVPPIANFTFTPETPYAYGTVTFDATASFNPYGSIMNYTWNFDDGNITTTALPIITHIFTTPDSYNVTLTVTDEFGLTNSTSAIINVLEDRTPPFTISNYDDLWRNADFYIMLTATDSESGVAETYYRINDGPIKRVSVDGHPLIITEGSNNTLEYWSVDRAGNGELPHKILTGIKLDKTAPSVVHVLRVPEDNLEPEQDVKVSVNVTDLLSGIQNVVLSYTLDFGTSWNNLTMTYNSTNGLYETTIKVQQANVQVKYKIIAYDNAGNCRVEDNNGQYYVYIVIPEFPSIVIILLLMLTILITTLLKKKGTTKLLNLIFSKF